MDDEIDDLIAEAARKAKVARTMIGALRTLEVIHHAGVVMDGEEHAIDFSFEILKLKAALQVMGVDYFENPGSGPF